jgi:hypothetical protein
MTGSGQDNRTLGPFYGDSSLLLGTPVFDEELVKFLQWLAQIPPERPKLLREIGYPEAVERARMILRLRLFRYNCIELGATGSNLVVP